MSKKESLNSSQVDSSNYEYSEMEVEKHIEDKSLKEKYFENKSKRSDKKYKTLFRLSLLIIIVLSGIIIFKKLGSDSQKEEPEIGASSLKETVEELEKTVSDLKKQISEIKDELQMVNVKLMPAGNILFKNSNVLKNDEERRLVEFWIRKKGNIKKAELIYKGTVDGDTSKDFYSKCTKVGPTLSLFETSNGKRFGAFTTAEWFITSDKKGIRKDNDAFIFSLDKKKIYPIKNPENAIRSIDRFCQIFGNTGRGEGFVIESGYLHHSKNFESRKTDEKLEHYDLPKGFELTGEYNFKLLENEVYRIEL